MCKNEIDVYPFDSYSPLVIDHRGKGMGGQKDINGKIYGCCTAIGAMGLGIVPFIIDASIKLPYYNGLKKWSSERGYLIGTCQLAQDAFNGMLDYFEIKSI